MPPPNDDGIEYGTSLAEGKKIITNISKEKLKNVYEDIGLKALPIEQKQQQETMMDKLKDKYEDIRSEFRVHPIKMGAIVVLSIAVIVLLVLLIIFITLYAHEDFKMPWDEL